MAGVERRLAAILAADAVGYSRLMGANETTTHTRLRQLQAGTVDPLAAQHHGRVVKLTGDGALMEFRSVVDAVHCAIAVQNAVAEREAESPQDQRIQFRIGINLGDVIVDGEDVYGDAVNIASRLEGLAEPSGIVVSDNAMQFLDEALRARFVDGGRHDLKNIERPIRIWRWLAQSDVRAQRKRLERPSVAVLPFDSLGPEPDQGYFADGITEDIITELARFPLSSGDRSQIFVRVSPQIRARVRRRARAWRSFRPLWQRAPHWQQVADQCAARQRSDR